MRYSTDNTICAIAVRNDFLFMLLIFVLTDANEATYSIEFDSNFHYDRLNAPD